MKKPRIIPDEPLPMAIPESPHWPLPRARSMRDLLSVWLAKRVEHRRDADALRHSMERVEAKGESSGFRALLTALHCDTQGIARLRRWYQLSALVVALEAKAAPPPQIALLAA